MGDKLDQHVAGSTKQYRDDDSVVNGAETICPCTDAVRSIPAEDSQVFESGTVFKAEIRFALADQATKYLYFQTPAATEEAPLYVVWGTDIVKADVNNVEYTLWEGAEFTGTVAQPTINQNRPLQGIVTAQTLLYNTATDLGLGSAVEVDLDTVLGAIGGPGVGVPSAGASSAGLRFLILKPSTKYVLEIFNDNGTDAANVMVKSGFLEGLFPRVYALANP